MDSELIMINKFKNIKRKRFNNILKFKNIMYIILFLFGNIIIIFFIYNNIDNKKLLKQILKDVNSNKNDTSLFNISYKDKDIKNRITLLKKFSNNNLYL